MAGNTTKTALANLDAIRMVAKPGATTKTQTTRRH